MNTAPLASEVRQENGVPVLYINGKPHTGLMHWNRYPTKEDIRIFRDAGIHLYSFMGTLPMRQDPDVPVSYADGLYKMPELSHEFLDEMLQMIEDVDPEAKIFIRFRITPPEWMRDPDAGNLCKVYSPMKKCFYETAHISVSDPQWRKEIVKAVDQTVDYLESKWAHRIVGYHPGMALCAENAHYWTHAIADFSQMQLKTFRQWLQNKYGSIENLNKVWHREYTAFDDAEFPDPELYFCKPEAELEGIADPGKYQNCIDFMDFSSWSMSDAVVFQAQTVKAALRRWNRTKVCGVFYAYELHRENSLSSFCSGHHDHDPVLNCPDVDMICSPLAYGGRQRGGISSSQVLPGSLSLHGKLYYGEDDYRYHMATEADDCTSADYEETVPLLIRNFLTVWRTGGTVWWMDLFGLGWYRDPQYIKVIQSCREFAEAQQQKRKSIAQIAVFVSDHARSIDRSLPGIYSAAVLDETISELSACGAPFDILRIEDLPELIATGQLKQYRFTVMTNVFRLSSELQALIDAHLKKDGRTILWIGCPGVIKDDVYSEQNICHLTGMKLICLQNSLKESLRTETFLNGHRFVYGDPRYIKPRMISADPDAKTQGWFIQGTYANYPGRANGGALIVKDFPDWHSIWSCSHGLPAEILTHYAKNAGVHIYNHGGNQILAAENWVALYAKSTGEHTIEFPAGFGSVREWMTGQMYETSPQRLTLTMARGDLRVFVKA